MRTKTGKEQKRIPPTSDRKICVSMPKVVLDASDCAKLLEGIGQTSVKVMERDGKIVAVSRSPSSASSTAEIAPSSSLLKSSVTTSRTSLSASAGSSQEHNSQQSVKMNSAPISAWSSLSSSSPSSSLKSNGKTESIDRKETSTITNNHAQDSIPVDQGKMILKPPKKRRVNDPGLIEDSTSTSSLVNGDHSGPDTAASISPVSLPFVGEAREAVALRSTPSLPVMTTASNSMQKHTIENLLQPSSYSTNNNNNNNNKNSSSSSSSNMKLISGLPYSAHQAYTPTPVIYPPIHPTAVSQHLHSTTTTTSNTVPLPVLPPTSLLSSHQSSALSSSSSSPSPSITAKCNVPPSPPPQDSSTQMDPNPAVVYNLHHHHHPISQVPAIHPHIPPSSVTVPNDEDLSDNFNHHPSLSTTPQPPSVPNTSSHTPFRTSPVQDEPINLSTTFPKPSCTSNNSEPSSEDHSHSSVVDNLLVTDECKPEGYAKQEMDTSSVQDDSCATHDESIRLQKQNSESRSADSRQCNYLQIKDTDGAAIAVNSGEIEKTSPQLCTEPQPGLCENSSSVSVGVNSDGPSASTVSSQVVGGEKKHELSHSSQDPSKSVVETGSSNMKSSSSSDSISTKDTSPLPEGLLPLKKAKKSSKKRVEIPMDEESCAMRSTSYCESIDHVIHHFEYVEKAQDEIELTEEEETILRQQFDDSVKTDGQSDHATNYNKEEKIDSHLHKNDELMSVLEGAISKPCSAKLNSPKVKPKSLSPGKSKPKKQRIEKLSPIMQNVVDVLSFVAANISDDTCPSESGLLDLEILLKSLRSKCQKRMSLLVNDNDCSDKNVVDNKTVLVMKKAKKTLTDISLFYPSGGDDSVHDEPKQTESSNPSDNRTKNDTHIDSKSKTKIQSKSKKPSKRKSDLHNVSARSEGETYDSESNSASDNPGNSLSKPKKVKKSGLTKVKREKQSSRLNKLTVNIHEPGSLGGQSTSYKIETSDIGESIASTSGGSDEQMTPVHEPDTKDEGVNTDLDNEAVQDTEHVEDSGEKPVRHYKKRLDFVKCSQCDHQCRGRSALSRHMKKFHLVEADMPYRCHLCTYGCTKMGSLNRHLYTHNVFACSRCDFRTDQKDKLTKHVAERHKDKLDMKLCKVCSRYIKCDRFTIEDHTNNCHGPTPFKCKECSKEFKYASSLRVHHRTHFPDEPKLHKCDLCDYRTNYKANLSKHHKNMHAVKDRQIPCPDCSKMFSSEDNMRRHRQIHTVTNKFSCETCKKSFKTASSLKGHQLIHTAIRPFTCSIPGCNRSFRTARFMRSHQAEFHRLAPKKFSCQVDGCTHSFFKLSHLKRHAVTHTGERNYHCAWPGCRKSFRHADNLKAHFRNHSTEILHCSLCDFKCKHRTSLIKHGKKIHGLSHLGPAVVKKLHSGDKDAISNAIRAVDVTKARTLEEKCLTVQDKNAARGDLDPKEKVANVKKLSAGSMDLYEFKSDGESEEEGPSPLRWDSVKSTVPATPLPPPPKELLLKNEKLEKKERDKVERAEKKEMLKKEKAGKKEQEKTEKAEKKNQEKKEKLEKKEQEKKEKEEKREQDKREKKEQKEKEKKEKEEMKEKEKKEKEEQKEREKREKEEQKEKEKKEKEELKEKDKLKKIEEKEKEKSERLTLKKAQREKLKKEKERKKMEVKRLKTEAKKVLQNRSLRIGRGVTRKASLLAIKSKSAKGKKGKLGKRKSPSRAASPRIGEENKSVKARKNAVESNSASGNNADGKKKRGRSSNKTPSLSNNKTKSPSQSGSPRSASPRGSNKSPKGDKIPVIKGDKIPVIKGDKIPVIKGDKIPVVKGGKKKSASSLPRRKPSARIKATQKTQQKMAKKGLGNSKKTVKGVIKKAVGKVGKKGRPPVKKKVPVSENESEEENVSRDDVDKEVTDEKVEEGEKKVDTVSDDTSKQEPDGIKNSQKTLDGEKKKPLLRSSSPTPSSSEEDMLQGKGSPYRDFSDAEDLDKEQKEEEIINKVQSQPGSSESVQDADNSLTPDESPQKVPEVEEEASLSDKVEEDVNQQPDDRPETDREEESSDDDEDINDIPLTPPRAPAPPPVESSEDELELPDDAMDSSAPYSTPAPNTPYSTPAPNTPYSTPAPNTPFSVPGPTTPFSVPPPTNLMQQHSVPSTEDLAPGGVSSVASLDLPSAGSVEMQPQGSVESSHPISSVEMQQHRNSSEMSHHNSVEMLHHCNSTENMPQPGSVEMQQHPHSVEMQQHPHSVEMQQHPHSVEMQQHPHSVEMQQHPRSVEMQQHPRSVEMQQHPRSVEMQQHPHSVEMQQHPHSVEMHPHVSTEMHAVHSTDMHHQHPTDLQQQQQHHHQHPHPPVDLPTHELMSLHHSIPASEVRGGHHASVDNLQHHQHHSADTGMVHSHRSSMDGSSVPPPHHANEDIPPPPHVLSQTTELSSVPTPPPHHLDKFSMHAPGVLDDSEGNASSEADKRCFDQYLRNLSAANNQAAAAAAAASRNGSGNLLVSSPDSSSRDRLAAKSPSIPLQSPIATSVITSLDTTTAPAALYHGQADLRRLEVMAGERQPPHPDPLYPAARDHMSAALSRQNTATPLLPPTNHATPAPPSFEAFPTLNTLHPTTARDNVAATSYLRQQENHLFATPPVTSSFMAEAMFQRQSMTTPFLPPPHPQAADRNALASRIPDPTASLRTNNTSSLLRRPSTMPATADMFAAPTVPQAVPRHPLTNAWSGQEVRPATHWQNPYFPRQTNMASAAAAANNPFFPAKENYLPSRDFMFDPTVHRSQAERGMFSSLASSQSQDSLQLDRFDLSNFFPGAVTPYGSSSSTLDYPRPSHSATPKPFDDRYRQSAASAGLPDFRGLPTPTSAATDRFPGIPGVNAGFNLYQANPSMTPYHHQHMTADNMNSAFLTHHPSTAQQAMLERDYAAAAAHRGLYPHQNTTPYPFIDDRQYSGTSAASKLGHSHATPATVAAPDRDLMSRSATQDSQMPDTYRSMLYRY